MIWHSPLSLDIPHDWTMKHVLLPDSKWSWNRVYLWSYPDPKPLKATDPNCQCCLPVSSRHIRVIHLGAGYKGIYSTCIKYVMTNSTKGRAGGLWHPGRGGWELRLYFITQKARMTQDDIYVCIRVISSPKVQNSVVFFKKAIYVITIEAVIATPGGTNSQTDAIFA
jgi:hypothetical protein